MAIYFLLNYAFVDKAASKGKLHVIMKSILLLTFICLFTVLKESTAPPVGQMLMLNGVVKNQFGLPISHCQVKILGTNDKTKTDSGGYFSLQSDEDRGILVFQSKGFRSQRQAFSPSLVNFEIRLQPDVAESEETFLFVSDRKRVGRPSVANTMGVSSPFFPSETRPQFNTEGYDFIAENGFRSVKENALSTFSIDTDGASYSNLRRFLKNGNPPPRDAIRIEEMINYFNYDYVEPSGVAPLAVNHEVGVCPWDEDHLLVHIGLQAKKMDAKKLPNSNLIFLIDVSGSMAAANKLPLLRSSFKLLVSQLRPEDRISIVTYAGSDQVVLAGASGEEKEEILLALDRLQSGGGTAGAQGLRTAYRLGRDHFIKGGNNRIILATDGDFNIGPSSDAEMVEQIEGARESGIYLSVLGFGMGNYKDNKMQKIANYGNGNHHYIDDINEARKVFVHEFGGTLFTVAKDVKIQVEFNPLEVESYRLIGYENRLLNDEDFNDDKKDAGEIGAGHTVTALYEVIPVGVKNKYSTSVDTLRYQKVEGRSSGGMEGEMMYVKIRYKAPQGSESKLMEEKILLGKVASPSQNFHWSAGVAAFGMVLRQSELRGSANTGLVLELLAMGKGIDPYGYRQELIGLVENVSLLAGN